MPTFFNPGGRTLAGGERMPWVILWPKADTVAQRISKIAEVELPNNRCNPNSPFVCARKGTASKVAENFHSVRFWEGHDFSRADKRLSVVIPSGLEAREESPFPTFSARQLSCQSVPPNWCSRNCALPDSHRTESFLLSLLLARV